MVVGHSLEQDFEHLRLNENEYSCKLRDISTFSRFCRFGSGGSGNQDGGKRKLRDLAADYLNADIQGSVHSSIIDARVALALYRTFQMEIEDEEGQAQQIGNDLSETLGEMVGPARYGNKEAIGLLTRLMSL